MPRTENNGLIFLPVKYKDVLIYFSESNVMLFDFHFHVTNAYVAFAACLTLVLNTFQIGTHLVLMTV